MSIPASIAPLRQDVQVIGLVGLAHGTSHFFHLILAPLFPLIKLEFGVSYAELGLLMAVFFAVSGIGQALAGFVVDRIGARPVLFTGIALFGVAALGLALAPHYAFLMLFSALAGLGNSVFHPADFTLLNQRVSARRMGHAFSVHGIAGSLGWALAPVFLIGLSGPFGWRGALLGAALFAFAVLAVLLALRGHLAAEPPAPLTTQKMTPAAVTTRAPAFAPTPNAGTAGSLDFLRLHAVWWCFAFFLISSGALAGIQSFSASALHELYGMSILLTSAGLTVYMLSQAGGMVVGGFLAMRAGRLERVIAAAFTFAGLGALLIASGMVPTALVLAMMGVIGFGAGIAGPSRDLLVRAASPANATGRVYGVVYSGLDIGFALSPPIFGAMMDAGQPQWVFILVAAFQMAAVLTAVRVGIGMARKRAMVDTVSA